MCIRDRDTYVELYHGGMVPLEEFAKRPVRRDDRDILVRIIIKKDGRKAAYTTQRNSETDFPVIACCVSRWGNDWYVAVGARPGRAQVVKIRDDGYDSLAQLAEMCIRDRHWPLDILLRTRHPGPFLSKT